ncbi:MULTISPECIES: WhiB family transcriptional regulator [unclassified Streptomyces]|uniref:WhiB family transcriptional regulator n=1 Tax=Streptomyces TaxID=1883 RepID=UPI0036E3124A
MDEDPELFFPVGTAGPALRDVSAAKRVCARCPVADPCLSFALSSGQASGVWGGTGEEERDALLRTTRNDARRRSAQ